MLAKALAFFVTLLVCAPIVFFTISLVLITVPPLAIVISFGIVGAVAALLATSLSNLLVRDGTYARQRRVLLRAWFVSSPLWALLAVLAGITDDVWMLWVVLPAFALMVGAAVWGSWRERSADLTWRSQTLEGVAWLLAMLAATVGLLALGSLAGLVGA